MKAVRDESGVQTSEIVSLLYNTVTHYDAGKKDVTGKAVDIPKPSADVVLIGPHVSLQYDREANFGYVPMNSVQDAIDAIAAKHLKLGRKVSVAIIEHGGPGLQDMGDGPHHVPGDGKYIKLNDPNSELAAFEAGVKGKVSFITLYGCNVAKSPDGPEFIKELATGTGATVKGYTGTCSTTKWWFLGWHYDYSSTDNANFVKKP